MTITARFPGRCSRCGGVIAVGQCMACGRPAQLQASLGPACDYHYDDLS